jgi:hypothetical protein
MLLYGSAICRRCEGSYFFKKPELLLAYIKNSRPSDVEFTHCLYKVIWEERVDRRYEVRWQRILLILNTHGEEGHEEHESWMRVLRLV